MIRSSTLALSGVLRRALQGCVCAHKADTGEDRMAVLINWMGNTGVLWHKLGSMIIMWGSAVGSHYKGSGEWASVVGRDNGQVECGALT